VRQWFSRPKSVTSKTAAKNVLQMLTHRGIEKWRTQGNVVK